MASFRLLSVPALVATTVAFLLFLLRSLIVRLMERCRGEGETGERTFRILIEALTTLHLLAYNCGTRPAGPPGDLFAGFHILVEKSMWTGDFVRIESG